ncbi:hypothetical protein PpBr36_08951 [Pyricularia pennisetigena]|uniref:hypothetical protein n=1 Tax=Pyricularia pennisetigena TaxID=1578925 RepID=UPI00115096DD|nr:hypothetical protein PpBr36_08951 [Pyricularia pennisetigena]TLS24739.1 hypothetical protein PpBr36_08951 [Pyricularia pennisetigena]
MKSIEDFNLDAEISDCIFATSPKDDNDGGSDASCLSIKSSRSSTSPSPASTSSNDAPAHMHRNPPDPQTPQDVHPTTTPSQHQQPQASSAPDRSQALSELRNQYRREGIRGARPSSSPPSAHPPFESIDTPTRPPLVPWFASPLSPAVPGQTDPEDDEVNSWLLGVHLTPLLRAWGSRLESFRQHNPDAAHSLLHHLEDFIANERDDNQKEIQAPEAPSQAETFFDTNTPARPRAGAQI